jgi:hypothetical protein
MMETEGNSINKSLSSDQSKKRKESSTDPIQTQEEVDNERGFNEDELKICLKVSKERLYWRFQTSHKEPKVSFGSLCEVWNLQYNFNIP